MKLSVLLIPLITLLSFTSCSGQEQLNQSHSDQTSPTTTEDTNTDNKYSIFDVSKEWDATDYKYAYNKDPYYFSAPIMSPYKYTYICEDPNHSCLG